MNLGDCFQTIKTSFNRGYVSVWLDLFISKAVSVEEFGLKYAGGKAIGTR